MNTTRIILTKDNATADNFKLYLEQQKDVIHEICERHWRPVLDKMAADTKEFTDYIDTWKLKMKSQDKIRTRAV
jgi:hypothetical protein